MIRWVLLIASFLLIFVAAQLLSAWMGAQVFAIGTDPDSSMIYAIIIAEGVGGGALLAAGVVVSEGRRDREATAAARGAILGAILALLSGVGGRHGR